LPLGKVLPLGIGGQKKTPSVQMGPLVLAKRRVLLTRFALKAQALKPLSKRA
jgi:hypothetical protein